MEITVSDLLHINKPNIIDIRSNEKFNDNHIPGALNIRYEDLINHPSKYLSKNETYYLYCQKGVTAKTICQILRTYGYNTFNVIGGYESYILKNV